MNLLAHKLNIISLGAGVQSSTMALMAAHGEITPMPDAAIFADTQDEGEGTYKHLQWLMSPNVLPFPVYDVSRGHLSEDLLAGDDQARIPYYVKGSGMGGRQCTRNYKIRPVRRKIRELLGRPGSAPIPPGTVSQWIGISTDEAARMKPSGVAYVVNRFPLIELGKSRWDCKRWLFRHDYPIPPSSACVYCPYLGDHQRVSLSPADHARAVNIDHRLREPQQIERFQGEVYVHRSCQPLSEVDLSTAEERGQLNLFNNECEGMCGV